MSEIIGNFLQGKKGIITGVANDKSLSWAIAKFASQLGAEICLTYQGEMLKKRVGPLADEINCNHVYECDVMNESSMDELFNNVKNSWENIDFLVHSIAFADKNELKGRYLETSLANFTNSMQISCYSLLSLTKRAEPLMNQGGSILALTYFGANKVVPNYNVMGVAKSALECSVRYLAYDLGQNNIRVNALSAGPVRTLASSGIGDFRSMLKMHEATSPLKRNTTHEDVASSAAYLLSDLSKGVSGEIHYVDAGYNIMGGFASGE